MPAGTYRLENVVFPSNVRMEVDAGAVIEVVKGGDGTAFLWQDGVTNVSLVGVGSSTAGKPDAAGGWNVDGSFTFDLDPAQTGTGADARGLSVLWAKDFLVQNVVIRQGSSCASCGTEFPNSNSAGITLRSQPGSSEARPLIPRRGTLENVYAVNAPPGYGPVQFGSGVGIRVDGMYSQGGTALRLETDAQKGRYSILDRLTARRIECSGGNAAVLAVAPRPDQRRGADPRRHGRRVRLRRQGAGRLPRRVRRVVRRVEPAGRHPRNGRRRRPADDARRLAGGRLGAGGAR